ncbi:MAG TPA: PQQ-dependent sugar dehydrogenase [Methylibium sp.]|nr:PQQ-dependent sugar dehydrogenase [Methylibium sp.]
MVARHGLSVSMAVAILLAACGGGGGGGDSGGGPGDDTEAPTATLTAPAAFADGLGGDLTLTASASDNGTVAEVEFQIDGMAAGSDSTAPYAVTIATTAHASGQHVLRARARDAAGNVSPWSSATVRFGGTRNVPAGFTLDSAWIGGLLSATAFAQAPDGRWFVAQQGGALRVVKDGTLLATPFITLSVDTAGERGLIGVALHPNFASNRWVYLHYTTLEGGAHARISRFTANPSNPDIVSVGSELRIADLPLLSSATNHNGGAMHFGTDGKLYVGVGDNNTGANAQSLASPLGKLLRFNDDGSIPGDNPFCTAQGNLSCAVWAYGLRNPFTFAVQPGTGRIHINDVGAAAWEEIDLGVAGANYGWPASEGPDGVGSGITGPLFAYGHADAAPPGSGPGGFFTGFAIAGGAFYPSSGNFPAGYRGSYFFADFVTRFVARLGTGASSNAYAFATLATTPVDLRVGLDGALYALTRSGITRIASTAP